MLRVTAETDFAPLYEAVKAKSDIPVAAILPPDMVAAKDTQDYATSRTETLIARINENARSANLGEVFVSGQSRNNDVMRSVTGSQEIDRSASQASL